MKRVFDVSIITSAYNSQPCLKRYFDALTRAINILAGNRILVEVVIVFNNATESEGLELKRFINDVSESKGVVINPLFVALESLYRSWNRGVRASSGRCICFWNVDDIRYPKALVKDVRLIENDVELIYFPFWNVHRRKISISLNKIISKVAEPFGIKKHQFKSFILNTPLVTLYKTERKLVTPPPFDRTEFTRSMHCGPFFMFHRSLFEKVGPFDEQFKIAGDFEWCVRAAKVTEFALSNRIAGEMIIDDTNLTGVGNPIHVAENNVIYLRNGVLDKLQDIDEKLMQGYSIDDMEFSKDG